MLSAFAVPNKDRGRDVLDKTTSQGKLHILLLNAIIYKDLPSRQELRKGRNYK